MTGYDSKREAAADKLQNPWNEDEWRRNNWRCGHGWLRGEQCEICNAEQEPPSEWAGIKAILDEYGLQAVDFVADFKAALAQPAQKPVNLLEARRIAAEYGTPDSQVDDGNLYFALSKCLEHIDAQPAQEPVREALKLALGALESSDKLINGSGNHFGLEGAMDGYYSGCFDVDGNNKLLNEAITAIQEALAQPAQEPVAREWNFCERCGKRTKDLTVIHTCTPP